MQITGNFPCDREVAKCHYRQMACVHYYALGKDPLTFQRFEMNREETRASAQFVDIKVAAFLNRTSLNFAKRRLSFSLYFFPLFYIWSTFRPIFREIQNEAQSSFQSGRACPWPRARGHPHAGELRAVRANYLKRIQNLASQEPEPHSRREALNYSPT